MNRMIRRLLLFLTLVLIVLLIIRMFQSRRESALNQQAAIAQYQLAADRSRADELYARLVRLQQMRDMLVMPQLEISIKL